MRASNATPPLPTASLPPPHSAPPRAYRYLDLIQGGFVTILIASNLIGVGKVWEVGGFAFSAAVWFFPLSYLFGDVLTEVYGYARTRRVVWIGFAALAFVSLMSAVVIALPSAPYWQGQTAYELVFGQTPRIVAASLIAFAGGEFANSYVLARLKVRTEGAGLATRLIGSTAVGQAIDSVLFFPLAFFGVWDTSTLIQVTLSNYVFKVAWEAVALPLTTPAVRWLKCKEQEDYFDRTTDFNPFKISGES